MRVSFGGGWTDVAIFADAMAVTRSMRSSPSTFAQQAFLREGLRVIPCNFDFDGVTLT